MRIQIIGAGAVGMLIGSFFAEAGMDVHFVCRRKEQVEKLSVKLIRENIDGSFSGYKVTASLEKKPSDFIFVTVKSGEVSEIIEDLPEVTPKIFVQNGLMHLNIIRELKMKKVAFASAQFGALKISDAVVSHRGVGVMKVAPYTLQKSLLETLLAVNSSQFFIQIVKDAEKMLIEKAIFNCLINPLTAILHVKNGELVANPHAHAILIDIHKELMKVFPEQCPSMEEVEALATRTAQNTSSMLSDHLMKRTSEAPAILGALIDRAMQKGCDLPKLNVLYQLILAKESEWQ